VDLPNPQSAFAARALRSGLLVAALAGAVAACGIPQATAGAAAQPASPPSVLVSDAFPGAAVNNVRPGSAAARAGLRTGDVVTGVDGKPVNTAQDLIQYLAKPPAGRSARLNVTRADGTSVAVSITLRVLSG
jgi:S1-C subfamily serine protease